MKKIKFILLSLILSSLTYANNDGPVVGYFCISKNRTNKKKRGLNLSFFIRIYLLGQALTGIIKEVFNTSLIPLTFLENFSKAFEDVCSVAPSVKVTKSDAPI